MDENQLIEFLQNNLRLKIERDSDYSSYGDYTGRKRLKVGIHLNCNGNDIEIDYDYIDEGDIQHILESK